mmetsp:Transcript_16384/g.35436  ORF Transcript_16384/g.35436 Transcript_16384/m.35436 type:complete len:306 (+) Transcript_16384:1670-2587(+)
MLRPCAASADCRLLAPALLRMLAAMLTLSWGSMPCREVSTSTPSVPCMSSLLLLRRPAACWADMLRTAVMSTCSRGRSDSAARAARNLSRLAPTKVSTVSPSIPTFMVTSTLALVAAARTKPWMLSRMPCTTSSPGRPTSQGMPEAQASAPVTFCMMLLLSTTDQASCRAACTSAAAEVPDTLSASEATTRATTLKTASAVTASCDLSHCSGSCTSAWASGGSLPRKESKKVRAAGQADLAQEPETIRCKVTLRRRSSATTLLVSERPLSLTAPGMAAAVVLSTMMRESRAACRSRARMEARAEL